MRATVAGSCRPLAWLLHVLDGVHGAAEAHDDGAAGVAQPPLPTMAASANERDAGAAESDG